MKLAGTNDAALRTGIGAHLQVAVAHMRAHEVLAQALEGALGAGVEAQRCAGFLLLLPFQLVYHCPGRTHGT